MKSPYSCLRRLCMVTLVAVCFHTAAHADFVFSTVAGLAGAPNDTVDGSAFDARFARPVGTAVDDYGNIYIADSSSHVIRKISSTRTVTVIAGSPNQAGSADGSGANARFNYPWGMALDRSGNLYVCDSGNNTIRKIDTNGTVSTLAGLAGYAGSDDGIGSNARFDRPSSVVFNRLTNSLFVTDYVNSTIRQVTLEGNVTTYAGTAAQWGYLDANGTAARFSYPDGIAVDAAGDLFVSDSNNHVIRKIAPNRDVTTIAGVPQSAGSQDGAAAVAHFNSPTGIAVRYDGGIYVTDTGNETIRFISAQGEVSTLGGMAGDPGAADGPGVNARFSHPIGMAITPADKLIISDAFNNTIRLGAERASLRAGQPDFNRDGNPDLVWQNTSTGEAALWLMEGTALDSGANLGTYDTAWQIVGADDFNGDGDPDILWQNTTTGQTSLWIMRATALDAGVNLGTFDTAWKIVGTGDFNADGSPDIIWQNTSTGKVALWIMRGTALDHGIDLGTYDLAWKVVGADDFNADGSPDIIWQNTSTGQAALWIGRIASRNSVTACLSCDVTGGSSDF